MWRKAVSGKYDFAAVRQKSFCVFFWETFLFVCFLFEVEKIRATQSGPLCTSGYLSVVLCPQTRCVVLWFLLLIT